MNCNPAVVPGGYTIVVENYSTNTRVYTLRVTVNGANWAGFPIIDTIPAMSTLLNVPPNPIQHSFTLQ